MIAQSERRVAADGGRDGGLDNQRNDEAARPDQPGDGQGETAHTDDQHSHQDEAGDDRRRRHGRLLPAIAT